MPKRFTATEKWEDPWFFKLDSLGKLAWLYLLDKCDHSGIYDVNEKLMEVYLGVIPDISWFKGRVIKISDEKWFIPKFIEFQYGNLNPDNRVHKSILNRVKKEGAYKGLNRTLLGPMDKDMDKDKDKDKEKKGKLSDSKYTDSNIYTAGDLNLKENLQKCTPLQKLVLCFKDISGHDLNDKAWDKINFSRCSKSAKQLLEYLGFKDSINAICDIYDELTAKNLTVTLETIVKHASRWKADKKEREMKGNGVLSLSGNGGH